MRSPSNEEIEAYHESIGANFGTNTPVEVVEQGLLKKVVGYANGSTCNAILHHHGLIDESGKVTQHGKNFAWETFSKWGHYSCKKLK